MIDLSFLGPVLNTLARLNSSKLITHGTRALAIVTGGITICYGIKKIGDYNIMEHGYKSDIKFGNFETKLEPSELDTTRVYIEPNKLRP